MARRKRSRKVSRKRSRKASRRVVHIFKANPKRRRARRSSSVKRSHRRRYRRNPSLGGILPTTGFVMDAVYVTGGFVGTKILAGMVLPMVGIDQPLFRIASKAVLAGALGYAGKLVMGKSVGQFLMLGGLVEAVNDAVQTYVAPMVPALAISSYSDNPYSIGVYPQLNSYVSGMVDDTISEQV